MKKSDQIDIKTNFDKKIKPELDRRVQLVASSVMGSFLSGDDPEQTSIRHVLNRAMVLLQMPLTFIICEKIDDEYVSYYKFNRHPRDQESLSNAFKNKPSITRPEIDGMPFQMFSTNYYLLPIVIGKNKDGTHNFYRLLRLKENQTPLTADDLASYQLQQLLNGDLYKNYGASFAKLIKKSIESCIDEKEKNNRWILDKSAPIAFDSGNKIKQPCDELLLKSVGQDFNRIFLENKDFEMFPKLPFNGYLDRIFRKIKNNLRIISEIGGDENSSTRAANYVMFLRDYAVPDGYWRHRQTIDGKAVGGYQHRVRIALCSSQKEDVRVYFTRLKNIFPSMQKLMRKTKGYSNGIENQSFHPLAEELEDYFWNELNKDNGIENFIKILEFPFGLKSRSASDIVFDGGIIHFRRPFADGGISRCFPEGLHELPKSLKEIIENRKKYGNIIDDLKRLIISYYWYQGMAGTPGLLDEEDSSPNTELGIMMVPIEIGNRIWCVIGYFTTLYKVSGKENNKNDDKIIDIDNNSSAWNINFHIFRDVNDRVKKDLRHTVSEGHRNLHAYYYGQAADKSKWGIIFKNVQSDADGTIAFQKWINDKYLALSSFFSYDLIQVRVAEGPGGPSISDERENNKNNVTNINTKSPQLGVRVDLEGRSHSSLDIESTATEESPVHAGAYLTARKRGETIKDTNPFFPDAPASGGRNGYNYVNQQDIQIRLTAAFVRRLWQQARMLRKAPSDTKHAAESVGSIPGREE